MDDRLADSRYSVERAKEHIDDLERESRAFTAKRPYDAVVKYDSQTGLDIHKIVLKERLPRRLPGLAFDAANNLRAALDQAGHAVAIAAGLSGKKAHFPFGDTRDQALSRVKGKGHSSGVPKDIFDVMVGLQPYRGGNALLWALNKFANTQKHETIVPVILASGRSSIRVDMAMVGPGTSFPPRWDRSKNEMEIMRVPHGHAPQYHLKFQVLVCIGKIEGIDGQPAIRVLRDMTSVVESCLVAIEAEARRIGISA